MANQRFAKVLAALLGRGVCQADDTAIFAGMSHDDLVRRFVGYLNAHRHFLGYCNIEECHALNDKGVDIVVRGEDAKIGFQLKSHFDVGEEDFAAKVKRQMTESFAHGLDQYFILVCCPLRHGAKDYSQKISHLLNELSVLKTPYHTAFGPRNAAQYFRDLPPLTRDELLAQKAVGDDCLHDYEKGYEHLPEPDSDEIRRAEEHLNAFGEDWWDEQGGQEAFDRLEKLMNRRAAEQFTNEFLPTIPEDVRRRREGLVTRALSLLADGRKCQSWDDKSEYKLSQWIDHVPEEMIPYTSLPNLLRITTDLQRYLEIHLRQDEEMLGGGEAGDRMEPTETAKEGDGDGLGSGE